MGIHLPNFLKLPVRGFRFKSNNVNIYQRPRYNLKVIKVGEAYICSNVVQCPSSERLKYKIDIQKWKKNKLAGDSALVKINQSDVRLPPLKGANVVEHFDNIAAEQVSRYKGLIASLEDSINPEMLKIWLISEGWTKYDSNGNAIRVPYPDENALIFDTENCIREGSAPTMACALGPNHWYSWCSKTLIATKRSVRRNNDESVPRIYHDDEMITMEPEGSDDPRIIIGHNVSFDRARIRNQYHLEATATRFLDTMSMYVCISGDTSF